MAYVGLLPSKMDLYLLPSTAVVTALAVSVLLFRRCSGSRDDKKIPPGPPPTFLVGHTFQVPMTRPWIYFENMGKVYGMVLYALESGSSHIEQRS